MCMCVYIHIYDTIFIYIKVFFFLAVVHQIFTFKIFNFVYFNIMTSYDYFLVGGNNALGTTTGWTVWGSNPSGGEIFRTRLDRAWGPPNLLYNGYRVSFPGVKRPGCSFDHPPPSIAEVNAIVELYARL